MILASMGAVRENLQIFSLLAWVSDDSGNKDSTIANTSRSVAPDLRSILLINILQMHLCPPPGGSKSALLATDSVQRLRKYPEKALRPSEQMFWYMGPDSRYLAPSTRHLVAGTCYSDCCLSQDVRKLIFGIFP